MLDDATKQALTISPAAAYTALFYRRPHRLVLSAGTISVYRPGSDIAVSGWTPSTGTDLYACIDETTASDADYITSPDVGTTPATFGLTASVPAGTWAVNLRGQFLGTSGQVRVLMQDSGGSTVGTSGWQALTGSFADYTLTVTTSGTAERVRIETQL